MAKKSTSTSEAEKAEQKMEFKMTTQDAVNAFYGTCKNMADEQR